MALRSTQPGISTLPTRTTSGSGASIEVETSARWPGRAPPDSVAMVGLESTLSSTIRTASGSWVTTFTSPRAEGVASDFCTLQATSLQRQPVSSPLAAEVGLLHLRISSKGGPRSAEQDAAGLAGVGTICDLERAQRILLDQQNRDPVVVNLLDDIEDRVHHLRGEPQRGFIE